ncbi:MAG: oligosaccharide flippase family protein [Flavobacteriales bacterium]
MRKEGSAAAPSFLRSVITLFSGTVIAQAIPFMFAPVIARLYGAEQFAVFGTLLAVFNILNVIAAARYEMAVVIPSSDEESAHLVRGAVVISLVMGAISFLGMLLLSGSAGMARHLPGLVDVAWVAAALASLAGLQTVLQQWLLRRKRFGTVARVKVIQAIVITVMTIAFGRMAFRNGLELGYLIGWAAFSIATIVAVARREPLPGKAERSAILQALHRYREWPFVNAWPALVNAVATGMATFYMVSFFSADISGQHNFCRQYVLVPISMITVALGQVLFVRASEAVREGRPLLPELMKVAKVLLLGAILMTVIVELAGPFLFRLVFGKEWEFAGIAARWLIPGYAAQLIGSPFGVVLLALRRVRATLIFPAVFFLLLLVVPVFRHWPPLQFMGLLAGVEVFAYAVLLVIVFRFVSQHDRSLTA